MNGLVRGLGGLAMAAAIVALVPQPASADMFGEGGPLCSVLSIGCPPPPPPPPPPEPVAAPPPAKPVHRVQKPKPKPKPAAAAAAVPAPKAEPAPKADK